MAKYLLTVTDIEDYRFFSKPKPVEKLRKQGRFQKIKEYGLDWMGAAFSNVDPEAFAEWENVCRKLKIPEGRNSYFDSFGVWGIDQNYISKMWFIAGCKNSEKYKTMLYAVARLFKARKRMDYISFPPVKKSDSLGKTQAICEGYVWHNLFGNNGLCDNRKTFLKMGKVSELTRYIISGLITDTNQPIDWEKVRAIQNSETKGVEFISSMRKKWEIVFGRFPFLGHKIDVPCPLTLKNSGKKAISAFIKLVKEFEEKSELNAKVCGYNLAAIYGSYEEAKRAVIAVKGEWNYYTFHDFAQFTVPKNWDPKPWKGFFQRFPQALKFAGHCDRFSEVPKNFAEFKKKISQFSYEKVGEHIELAQICFDNGLDQYQFDINRNFLDKKSGKLAETLPYVQIELDGYTFKKLDSTDPRGILLGLLTDCCQHLNGVGASCAMHGYESPLSGFYVIEKNGKIVAQSWAWRAKNGALIFDSVEALGDYRPIYAELYRLAAEKLIGKLGVWQVLIGSTGYGVTRSVTEAIVNSGVEIKNYTLENYSGYMDGRQQIVICSDKRFKQKSDDLKKLAKQQLDLVINELLPGSDVFCEHCDAEVHPNCEVCPNCGENIAEWVD